jgi:hypothetical protein
VLARSRGVFSFRRRCGIRFGIVPIRDEATRNAPENFPDDPRGVFHGGRSGPLHLAGNLYAADAGLSTVASSVDLYQRSGGNGGWDWGLFFEMAATGWLGIDRSAGRGFSVERPHAGESCAAGWKARGGVDFLGPASVAGGVDLVGLSDLCEARATQVVRFLKIF